MLTPRENFIRFFKNEPSEWMPSSADYLQFTPQEIPENVARGFVSQQNPFPRDKFGGRGFFGIDWIFEELVGGSMEVSIPLEDIEEWEDKIPWPDLDAIDWEGCKARNSEYLQTDRIIRSTIFTGFYERLISFVGFENAAIALVDEDQQEIVHKLFDKLADLYIEFIQRMHRTFNVEIFELHDDWGSQRAPFFSAATHNEMIVPYIRKVVEGAHAEGCFIEMHSCGHIDPIFENVIATGVDTWRGQATAVDRPALVAKYGDRFKFGAGLQLPREATDEQVLEAVQEFKKLYGGKNIWLVVMRMPKHQLDMVLAELAK